MKSTAQTMFDRSDIAKRITEIDAITRWTDEIDAEYESVTTDLCKDIDEQGYMEYIDPLLGGESFDDWYKRVCADI